MTTPTHYYDFKPCDAVTWTGTEEGFDTIAERLADQGFDIAQAGDMCKIWASDMSTLKLALTPGQWLIRQDGKVWVQDEEPPRVKEWEYAKRPHDTASGLWFKCERDKTTHCRPVLSNGWEGPWEAVDGDS